MFQPVLLLCACFVTWVCVCVFIEGYPQSKSVESEWSCISVWLDHWCDFSKLTAGESQVIKNGPVSETRISEYPLVTLTPG